MKHYSKFFNGASTLKEQNENLVCLFLTFVEKVGMESSFQESTGD